MPRRRTNGCGLMLVIGFRASLQSSGLNLIENLWHVLVREVRKLNILRKGSLKSVVSEELAKLGAETTRFQVRSMPRSLQGLGICRLRIKFSVLDLSWSQFYFDHIVQLATLIITQAVFVATVFSLIYWSFNDWISFKWYIQIRFVPYRGYIMSLLKD
jgi:hypothetical protein